MVHKVLFWGGFGVVVRLWQLGIQMKPILNMKDAWAWPVFGGAGASFGYWLQTVETSQKEVLDERRTSLLAKRARRAEREKAALEEGGDAAAH